jgi:hypothetical protein
MLVYLPVQFGSYFQAPMNKYWPYLLDFTGTASCSNLGTGPKIQHANLFVRTGSSRFGSFVAKRNTSNVKSTACCWFSVWGI